MPNDDFESVGQTAPPNRKSCRLLFHPQTSEYGAAFHVPSLPNFKSTMRKNLAKSCGCFVIRIGLLGLLKVKGERERILESRAVLLSMAIMAPRDVRIASLRGVKRQLLQKHTLQTTVLFARTEKGNATMLFLHAQK